jgi:hypothetical protein
MTRRFFIPTQAGIAIRIAVGGFLLLANPDATGAGILVFLVGVTAFSCVPYAVTYFLTQTNPTRGAIVALCAVAADVAAVLQVIVWPQSSTDGLIILFMPLVNLLVVMPIAYIGTTIVQKLRFHSRT